MADLPYGSFLVLMMSWGLANFCFVTNDMRSGASPKYLTPPPEYLEFFSFGFNESLADSLWLRWIQDNDSCQTYTGAAKLEVPEPKVLEDKLVVNPRHKFCDNSWAFKMLDATTRLAPKFKMPYEAGAITLSVLTEDYAGATILFDRGVKAYPEDWVILYRAAYHFLYDVNDLPKAAELLVRASRAGAPYWLNYLAARIYTKVGRAEIAIGTLMSYRETVKEDPKALQIVDERIAEIRKNSQDDSKEP